MGFNGIYGELIWISWGSMGLIGRYDGYPQLISLWVVAKSCTLDG